MIDMPDEVRTRESQWMLGEQVSWQRIKACPACGSVFLLHLCQADPLSFVQITSVETAGQ